MEETFSFVNGDFIESSLAKISVFDRGFTVADGVFETLKFDSGIPFALTRHLKRLEVSCASFGIAFPQKSDLINVINLLSENSKLTNGRMRITITSGSGLLGSDRLKSNPSVVISVTPQKLWPSGAKALLVPWIRNESSPLVAIKTTSYAENVFSLSAAHSKNYDEAIFLNSKGQLTEGNSSNIFLIRSGNIFTPPISSGLLPGITRELMLDWLSTEFAIVEKEISEIELFEADELFLTSSIRNIQPITNLAKLSAQLKVINEKLFNSDIITRKIQNIFIKRSYEQIDP